jgi:hypothetical protein
MEDVVYFERMKRVGETEDIGMWWGWRGRVLLLLSRLILVKEDPR